MNSIYEDATEAITLYQMCIEMSDRGNHDLAIEILDLAISLAPKFGSVFCEIGMLYERLGKYPELNSKFDSVLQNYPLPGEEDIIKEHGMEKIREQHNYLTSLKNIYGIL